MVATKLRPVRAVEPGRAHDVAGVRQQLAHRPLAGELAAAVGVDGAVGASSAYGVVGVAGEDVVGGDVHQPRAGRRRRPARGWPRPSPLTAVAAASSASAPSTSVHAAALTTTSWPATAVAHRARRR